jgi:nucleoside 2-deoxyribosyltransferase
VRIYLAGPLFTPYERRFLDECAARLRADGFDVFVPHEHALALGDTISADVIFTKDWDGLYNADAVLAVLDGPQTDDGTACEIGIFYTLMLWNPAKKGIVGLLTDLRGARSGEGHGLNLFVEGCIQAGGEIVEDLDAAATVLAGWR